MASYGITLEELEKAVSKAQSNTGGGIINRGALKLACAMSAERVG